MRKTFENGDWGNGLCMHPFTVLSNNNHVWFDLSIMTRDSGYE